MTAAITAPVLAGGGFDPKAVERGLDFLDLVPPSLLPMVITLPGGDLESRSRGVRRWHDALMAGHMPPADEGWPSDVVAGPTRQALTELGLARFCKNQPGLVDELLAGLLDAWGRHSESLQRHTLDELHRLCELERRRIEEHEARQMARRHARRRGNARQSTEARPPTLDEATLARLQAEAAQLARSRTYGFDVNLTAAWQERARLWNEVADVFGDLGALLGRGWDLSMGVLRHTGWGELLALRKLVSKLEQVRDIVRTLGRLQHAENEESVADTIWLPVRRLEEERRLVRTPELPTEARGIERGGDIGRMLPAEAVLLGHPRLRMLWHARRAERALITYRFEGTTVERRQVEREHLEASTAPRPRPERGPIIAVIDTSGSMHGLPERVAKALVLEALRTAHAEKRRCFLFAYSGPGQIIEHELDVSDGGIGQLLRFLGMSFHGGNDEAAVLERVLARLESEGWKKADVVFASDGEWPAPARVQARLKAAKEAGTRFHGVQIGNVGRTGLHAVCDPVHVFHDWAALSGRG